MLGLAIIAPVALLAFWLFRCFDEHIITAGSFKSLTIGDDKPTTLQAMLVMQKAGTIQGFWGLDDHPDPAPQHYEWTAAEKPEVLARLRLYDAWRLVGVAGNALGVVRFEGGKLAFIDTYDERGYLVAHAKQWSLDPTSGWLRSGMSPDDALTTVRSHLSRGLVSSVRTTEKDVAPPTRFDQSAIAALQPWDVWQLGSGDYGGYWLTFKDGRLVKIHRRVQCIELP